MCGIVGAIAQRDVEPILLEGLSRLEYRGYDSAGVAVMQTAADDTKQSVIQRARALGKVAKLKAALQAKPLDGHVGIAHTRWATHGKPSETNAHPHVSRSAEQAEIAVVHNGIIENHAELKLELIEQGYTFASATDTEVIVHLLHSQQDQFSDLHDLVKSILSRLRGAYALAVLSERFPDQLVVARSGSPLVIGVGLGENFIASDVAALLPVTDTFVFLEEGETATVGRNGFTIYAADGTVIERAAHKSKLTADAIDKGEYRHYMLKEIYEQPHAIQQTLEGRLADDHILSSILGPDAEKVLKKVKGVHIIACGTSYHAGLIARYWIEELARIPCVVEIASEYRYRQPVVRNNRLFVTISQSGETADSLAALRLAKELGYRATLTICNVPESSLVRESDFALMTRAGPEIGVASTKAFTTQLVALLLLAGILRQQLTDNSTEMLVEQLQNVEQSLLDTLALDKQIHKLAERFGDKHHALFLGRGSLFPVALEGALKLKEISYIHAEAYAAGELKHGPLALVDEHMPIIAVAPNNELLEKLKSNLEEVRARGGQLIVFADANAGFEDSEQVTVINVPHVDDYLAPIIYTLPLQLLSYHVAVLKGTDVDQPRNLAKSVTVE